MELIELARVVAARQEKPKEKTEKPKKDTPEPKEAEPSVVSSVNYSATIVKQRGNHELIIS